MLLTHSQLLTCVWRVPCSGWLKGERKKHDLWVPPYLERPSAFGCFFEAKGEPLSSLIGVWLLFLSRPNCLTFDVCF